MSNSNDYLLHRYSNGTATPEEREEFLKRFQAGELDDEISPDICEMLLEEQTPLSAKEQLLLSKIHDRIREQNPVEPAIIPFQRKKALGVWLAAASFIIILIVAGLWIVKQEKFTTVLNTPQNVASTSVYKDKQVITLPDGTKVVLNKNSELRFDPSFGKGTREVSLTGEASFDVAHDASKPFIVHTGSVATKVLGTAFNINAYPGQKEMTVTVLRGLVEVGDDQRVYDKISPDQQLVVNVSSHVFEKKNTDSEKALAWQNNFLILNDVTLEEAAKIIGKKFNVEITLEHDGLKKCSIHATFLNDEGLTEVLELLGEVLNVKFTVEEEGKVTLYGKGCN